jgi:hypothetical protein|tara:strand:- start:1778 stop:2356 length:579 start_codon:yes stop_codon:yes gene_type:complete
MDIINDININDFKNTIYDESLYDYINGNLIVKLKKINRNDNEVNKLIKNITIDFYLHKNKISNNNENYIKYSNIYDNIINNTTIEKKFNNIVNTRFYDSEEFINSEKEEKEWEEDKRLHYQSYFGRYNDLLHIINYYDKLIEEQENKEYNFEDEEKELKFDDEEFDEYYDDYYDENYENEYYEEYYDDDFDY